MASVANKAAGDGGTTKTVTDFVTSYVTAVASTVVVSTPQAVAAAGSGVKGLPIVVAVPDQAGNAGLIGRSRVYRS